jgi:DNA-binding response OmpR family regulator
MKVLAIDDQPLVLLPIQKRLTELGYEVKIETNSVKGLELYKSFIPDLVIVDIQMPVLSGLDVVKHIRQSKNHQTPIMVLSGNTQDNIITEGFDLGINDYMKKPISLNEICARVKRLIGVPEGGKIMSSDVMIQQRCVGVVIPCYNEEAR